MTTPPKGNTYESYEINDKILTVFSKTCIEVLNYISSLACMREGGCERRENEIIKSALRLAFRMRGYGLYGGGAPLPLGGSPSVLGTHHQCWWYILLVVAPQACRHRWLPMLVWLLVIVVIVIIEGSPWPVVIPGWRQ
jgi:hypothetical protein